MLYIDYEFYCLKIKSQKEDGIIYTYIPIWMQREKDCKPKVEKLCLPKASKTTLPTKITEETMATKISNASCTWMTS